LLQVGRLLSGFIKSPATTASILLVAGGSNVLSIRCWPVRWQQLIVEIIKRSNAIKDRSALELDSKAMAVRMLKFSLPLLWLKMYQTGAEYVKICNRMLIIAQY
jgi:hypothetical protein